MLGTRRIFFSVNWILATVVAAIVVVAWFAFGSTDHRPLVVFTASVIGGAAALVSTINALDARVQGIEDSRRLSAATFTGRWNDPQMYHTKKGARECLDSLKKLDGTEEQFQEYRNAEPGLVQNLLNLLNFLEELSISVQLAATDSQTAKRFFGAILVIIWQDARQFIEQRRDASRNPRLFCELEWLFEHWEKTKR